MATQRHDPYRNFNFRVGIGGRARAADGYSEVRLPTLLVRPDVAADVDKTLGDSLGEGGSAHLVLRRGFTGALDLHEWWNQQRSPKQPRGRIVTVDLLDETNNDVAASWRFTGCRPVALQYSTLNALESAVVIETIVLSYEDVEIA